MLAQGQQWNLALQDIQLSVEAGYPKGKGARQKLLTGFFPLRGGTPHFRY